MSKGVQGTAVSCTTIANLTERSETEDECQHGSVLYDYYEADRANVMSETAVRILFRIVVGLFSEGENEAEAC